MEKSSEENPNSNLPSEEKSSNNSENVLLSQETKELSTTSDLAQEVNDVKQKDVQGEAKSDRKEESPSLPSPQQPKEQPEGKSSLDENVPQSENSSAATTTTTPQKIELQKNLITKQPVDRYTNMVPINVLRASTSLYEKLNELSGVPSEYTIYRVHHLLRNVNPKAYEPEVIAIGPYHHGKDHLKMMEEHKLRFLQRLLYDSNNPNIVVKLVTALAELETEARRCYADQPKTLTSDEFIQMLVLDGCFIVQLVCKFAQCGLNDPIFKTAWMINGLQRDLMLFENQLPFFVLCELYDLIEGRSTDSHFMFCGLLYHFFKDLLPGPGEQQYPERSFVDPSKVRHLLEFIHLSWFPRSNVSRLGLYGVRLIDNVRILEEANVKLYAFEVLKSYFSKVKHLLDSIHLSWFPRRNVSSSGLCKERFIDNARRLEEANVKFGESTKKTFSLGFKEGEIMMAPLTIEDVTESVLRNLIAYEQYFGHNDVTEYAEFLDCIIDSSKDVEILVRRGVIKNWLGDDNIVAEMVNKLCVGVCVPSCHAYKDMFDEVNRYCEKRRNKWMAKLRHNYFNSPWAVISVLVAMVLLLLTVTQTVFGILQVV